VRFRKISLFSLRTKKYIEFILYLYISDNGVTSSSILHLRQWCLLLLLLMLALLLTMVGREWSRSYWQRWEWTELPWSEWINGNYSLLPTMTFTPPPPQPRQWCYLLLLTASSHRLSTIIMMHDNGGQRVSRRQNRGKIELCYRTVTRILSHPRWRLSSSHRADQANKKQAIGRLFLHSLALLPTMESNSGLFSDGTW
jgi:hypothetical protein